MLSPVDYEQTHTALITTPTPSGNRGKLNERRKFQRHDHLGGLIHEYNLAA